MSVGFIGLGVMGQPMARHVLEAGFDVCCYNRSSAAVETLVAAGATAAASVAELAKACDIIVTCLPDAPDVRQVLLGPDGVFANAAPGTVVVDCSTIAPSAALELALRASAQSIGFLDAPVSGGEVGARAGTLAVMVGGDEADLARARPVLSTFGKTVIRVGDASSGQSVKAANQLLVAGTLALLGEAILLLEASGVDLPAALNVLGGGLAGSKVLELKAPAMIARNFTPGFRVDLHHKDLGIVLASAGDHDIALPVTSIVAQLLVALRASGDGSLDHSALYKVVAALSGREIVAQSPTTAGG
jgi:2-hydroxy-3-oxopropionate reductase